MLRFTRPRKPTLDTGFYDFALCLYILERQFINPQSRLTPVGIFTSMFGGAQSKRDVAFDFTFTVNFCNLARRVDLQPRDALHGRRRLQNASP